MTVKSKSVSWNRREVTVVGLGPRLLAAMIDSLIVGFFGFALAVGVGTIAVFAEMFNPQQSSGYESCQVV